VVIAGGPDRAARKTLSDVTSALESDKHAAIDVFTIAAGAGAVDAKLQKIGRAANYQTGPLRTVAAASTQAGDAIESHWKRYYLLSYCTPARKGEHKVRVEVKTADPPATGAISYSFVADGMGPGCNPDKPPKFAGLDTSSDGPIRKEDVSDVVVTSGGTVQHAVVAAHGQTLGKIAAPAKLGVSALAANDAQTSGDDAADDDSEGDDKSGDKKRGSKKPAKKSDKDQHEKTEAKKVEKAEEKKAEAKKAEPKKPEAKKPEPKKAAPAPKKK
jgi:hypothetical protein